VEDKIVFGFIPDNSGKAADVVVLGIPTAAWEYMKDGHTHTLDLTKIGIPMKLILFGSATHQAALDVIKQHNEGKPMEDRRHEDFSVKPDGS
jgi:hypothetical protein